ncbi:hypothetical protein, partial [Terrimonas pollutisoli]|uniref:hypothetical protein n=1 Tax=Terrimonas pollutisoli TaxID=3034147 RepID=UPI0023EDE47B
HPHQPRLPHTNPHNYKQRLPAGSVQLRVHRWPFRPDELLVVVCLICKALALPSVSVNICIISVATSLLLRNKLNS